MEITLRSTALVITAALNQFSHIIIIITIIIIIIIIIFFVILF